MTLKRAPPYSRWLNSTAGGSADVLPMPELRRGWLSPVRNKGDDAKATLRCRVVAELGRAGDSSVATPASEASKKVW